MIPAEQQHPTNTTTVAFYPDHPHLMAPHYRYHHPHRHNSYHHYDQRSMPMGQQQQQQPSQQQQQHHLLNRKRLSTSKTATMLMDKPRKSSTTVMPYPLRRPLLSPSSPERLLLLDEVIPVEAQKPSPSTSCSSSSTTSSSPSPRILQPPHTTTSATSKPNTSTTHHLPPATPARTLSPPSMYYFTWLVFLHEKWVPFDAANQSKLEQTLTLGGTFVDVSDTHFPKVKRVRVFPKNNYLSYLGVKYRLSRIMQPDAWLDHKHLAATSSSSPDDEAIDNSCNRENAGINGNHSSGASPWIP
ncbi:hypothetical protein O0I10_002264 [Lichtheimia ornata]|uniref:WWE domain-containing protein n=1 Tax=Lichtheimia ornata TaxID=688661 RepID=A0AAD7VB60_9FUNG|nr:uncharacterized protein O0I10_002264 [Lichtheimia ornata]KAJ8661933.1 hypothetical protein O0I10_002264 [Lichtheimia ornata]